jgi:hypothetical protein
MNSSKKIKSDKAKSRSEWEDELSEIIARAEAAAEVNAAKAIAAAPAINARLNQYFEELRREAEEAVRLHEARVREAPVTRELLVEALGMLGSVHFDERAAAALKIESLRAKLNKTWNELIVWDPDDEDDEDYDDEDDDDDDEDEE